MALAVALHLSGVGSDQMGMDILGPEGTRLFRSPSISSVSSSTSVTNHTSGIVTMSTASSVSSESVSNVLEYISNLEGLSSPENERCRRSESIKSDATCDFDLVEIPEEKPDELGNATTEQTETATGQVDATTGQVDAAAEQLEATAEQLEATAEQSEATAEQSEATAEKLEATSEEPELGIEQQKPAAELDNKASDHDISIEYMKVSYQSYDSDADVSSIGSSISFQEAHKSESRESILQFQEMQDVTKGTDSSNLKIIDDPASKCNIDSNNDPDCEIEDVITVSEEENYQNNQPDACSNADESDSSSDSGSDESEDCSCSDGSDSSSDTGTVTDCEDAVDYDSPLESTTLTSGAYKDVETFRLIDGKTAQNQDGLEGTMDDIATARPNHEDEALQPSSGGEESDDEEEKRRREEQKRIEEQEKKKKQQQAPATRNILDLGSNIRPWQFVQPAKLTNTPGDFFLNRSQYFRVLNGPELPREEVKCRSCDFIEYKYF